VIGKVSFLWKPASEGSQTRNLWIWIHPAFYFELLQLLKSVFSFEEKTAEINGVDEPSKKKLKFVDPKLEQRLETRNVGDKIPVLVGRFREAEVTALLLRDTLNRFRLVGPLSTAVLKRSLHLPKLAAGEDVKMDVDDDNKPTVEEKFWCRYHKTCSFFVTRIMAKWAV